MGVQWELYNKDNIGGPMKFGANENCLTRITLGNQWDGGLITTVWPGLHWVTNDTGDQWELYDQDYIG